MGSTRCRFFVGFFLLWLVPWPSVGQGATVGFSQDQVLAGRRTYRQSCAGCHGLRLQGIQLAPSLVGARFDQLWRGKSAEVLSFHLHRMPPEPMGEPGSLGEEAYTNILAYILSANGLEPGEAALPSQRAALADLVIPKLEGVESDLDAPVAMSPAQKELLESLPAVTAQKLRDPSPDDWLQWGRTYDGQRFSPLKQINRETVGGLKLAWRAPLRNGTNMPTPLVHRGVMFFHTFPDTVLALDASNGAILWRYQRRETNRSSQKMGMALAGEKVLVPTSDLHVVALNAKTGQVLWDHGIALDEEARGAYQLRSAPLVVGDKVVQGVTGSGAPRGAFIVALQLETGEEVWRFNTIARPGEPNGDSWNGLPIEKRSGGSVWHQGTYDAELGLIYFGVAPTYDTGPLLRAADQEGVTNDAYYTNCTVALDADTGKLVWYYQHMPNDQWDLDWVFERQIVELPVQGERRKVVMNVGKMAILDALDAATGEYLFSVDAGVQNVITAIDPKTGAKTYDPDKMPDPRRPSVVCPSAVGARSWPPTSYSPRTGLVYAPLTEWCMLLGPEGARLLSSGVGISQAEHPDNRDGMLGRVQAINVETRQLAWAHHQATPPSTAVLATAGGVVFSGDLEPSLKAFDDESGELLWQAALDAVPSSSLITYSVNGDQYMAVVLGMTNFHVAALLSVYREFSSGGDESVYVPPRGGAAVWVFSL